MNELSPARRSVWKKIQRRLPKTRGSVGLAGPNVAFDESNRSKDVEAVRRLCIGLSSRAVLYAGGELEMSGEAIASAEAIRAEADEARKALSRGSSLDSGIEVLQDACNELRFDLRKQPDHWPFGEALLAFRSTVYQWAAAMQVETKLDEARRLVERIDLTNAENPNGPVLGTIYVQPPPDAPQ